MFKSCSSIKTRLINKDIMKKYKYKNYIILSHLKINFLTTDNFCFGKQYFSISLINFLFKNSCYISYRVAFQFIQIEISTLSKLDWFTHLDSGDMYDNIKSLFRYCLLCTYPIFGIFLTTVNTIFITYLRELRMRSVAVN